MFFSDTHVAFDFGQRIARSSFVEVSNRALVGSQPGNSPS